MPTTTTATVQPESGGSSESTLPLETFSTTTLTHSSRAANNQHQQQQQQSINNTNDTTPTGQPRTFLHRVLRMLQSQRYEGSELLYDTDLERRSIGTYRCSGVGNVAPATLRSNGVGPPVDVGRPTSSGSVPTSVIVQMPNNIEHITATSGRILRPLIEQIRAHHRQSDQRDYHPRRYHRGANTRARRRPVSRKRIYSVAFSANELRVLYTEVVDDEDEDHCPSDNVDEQSQASVTQATTVPGWRHNNDDSGGQASFVEMFNMATKMHFNQRRQRVRIRRKRMLKGFIGLVIVNLCLFFIMIFMVRSLGSIPSVLLDSDRYCLTKNDTGHVEHVCYF